MCSEVYAAANETEAASSAPISATASFHKLFLGLILSPSQMQNFHCSVIEYI